MSRSIPVPTKEDWDKLIFGSFGAPLIQKAVADANWQQLRLRLLGMPHPYKYSALRAYIRELEEVEPPLLFCTQEEWDERVLYRKIRCTNYVHALRRGGLIP
jgi:hypothetical protein